MAQDFTDDCFAAGNAGLTDLQNMENNFQALKTLFAGSSAPANTTAAMPWADTSTGVLKIRNAADDAWHSVIDFSTNSTTGGSVFKLQRTVSTGTGITGGGQLTTDISIGIESSGVGNAQLASSAVTIDKVAMAERWNIGSAGSRVSVPSGGYHIYMFPFLYSAASTISADVNLFKGTTVSVDLQLRIFTTAFSLAQSGTAVSENSSNSKTKLISVTGTALTTGTVYTVSVYSSSTGVGSTASYVQGARVYYS